MNSLSIDIISILKTQNPDEFSDNIFVGKEPILPNDCITIYDTGGVEQNPKLALDDATLQIRSRNIDYAKGFSKLSKVKLAIEGLGKTVLDNSVILGVWCNSNIAFMKYDVNDRAIFTINVRVIREPTALSVGNRQLI